MNEKELQEISTLLKSKIYSVEQLAEMFGLDPKIVENILKIGKTIPKKKKRDFSKSYGPTVQLGIRVPISFSKAIDEVAAKNDETKSSTIVGIIFEALVKEGYLFKPIV